MATEIGVDSIGGRGTMGVGVGFGLGLVGGCGLGVGNGLGWVILVAGFGLAAGPVSAEGLAEVGASVPKVLAMAE